jgi:hypothetical protein
MIKNPSTSARQILLCILAVGNGMIFAVENQLGDAISGLNKELAQIRSERRQNSADVRQDSLEENSHLLRVRQKTLSLQNETDSVYREIAALKKSADSTAAVVQALRARTKQYEMLQEGFRHNLSRECTRMLTRACAMPPLVNGPIISALVFLRGELEAKTCDNQEALQRLDQTARDMLDATMSIQDAYGQAPIPAIKTIAGRIRIGCLFEGVADEKGSAAALWLGNDSTGAPTWEPITGVISAQAVADAVAMREGKKLPSIVALPFSRGTGRKGENQ